MNKQIQHEIEGADAIWRQKSQDLEERLRDILESMAGWVWEVDENGVYTYASDRVEYILGYKPEELLGKQPFDLMPPDEAERIKDEFLTCALNGVPLRDLENWNLTKDGCAVCLLTSGVPLRDDEGRLRGYRGVDRDITQRKTAELALQESEAHFREFVEGTQDLVIQIDTERQFTYVNHVALRVFGMTPEQCIGQSLLRLVLEEDRGGTLECFETAVKQRRVLSKFENRIINVSTHAVSHMLWTCTFHYGKGGELINVNGIGHDITDRKRVEEEKRLFENQMQQTQRLESLGVLAGGVAHDFNNLHFAILANVELALLDLDKPDVVRTRLEEVQNITRRASELTSQLQAYAGDVSIRIEVVNLSDLIRGMTDFLDIAHSRHTTVEFALSDSLPVMRGDSTRLRQVMLNLVTNASEALGKEGGTITVSTGVCELTQEAIDRLDAIDSPEPGPYVMLEVHDDGCGMDADTKQRLFEPFFTTKFIGRGLGMAATLGIVRSHGGAIAIDSEPGQGTTVRVYFPVQ